MPEEKLEISVIVEDGREPSGKKPKVVKDRQAKKPDKKTRRPLRPGQSQG